MSVDGSTRAGVTKRVRGDARVLARAITLRSKSPQALARRIRLCLRTQPDNPQIARSISIQRSRTLFRSTEAAALIEFAVALPLLVVLVVGVFDFGGAFNLKQELNNAVRDAARFSSAQPANDVISSATPPPSVDAVRFVVDSYLQTAKINDCGLNSVAGTLSTTLTWLYTAPCGPGQALTLTINRNQAVPENISGATIKVLGTTVTITYPYQWHFNSVIQLLVPGANYTFTDIHSEATAINMN